eukprot:scaffold33587_cov107-Skeletonema_dohrnii-CCMP3373.AAC.11
MLAMNGKRARALSWTLLLKRWGKDQSCTCTGLESERLSRSSSLHVHVHAGSGKISSGSRDQSNSSPDAPITSIADFTNSSSKTCLSRLSY